MELEFNDLPPEIHEQIFMDNASLLRTARGLSKGVSEVTQRAYYRQICAEPVILTSPKEIGSYLRNNDPRIIVIYNETRHSIIDSPISLASIFILISNRKYILLKCELSRGMDGWSFSLLAVLPMYDNGLYKWYSQNSYMLPHRSRQWPNAAILPLDPLTYHNIIVNRRSCMKINPNYAVETTLQKFDEFVFKKQKKGTSRGHLELFNYLLALTWVFNISSAEQNTGAYDIIGRQIPESSTGIPDLHDPIIGHVIQHNQRLIGVYREIIKSLGREDVRTADPTDLANHMFHSRLLSHPNFSDIRRPAPVEMFNYISRNPRLMVFYWENRESEESEEFTRELQHSVAWIEILINQGNYIRLECRYHVTQSTWSIELLEVLSSQSPNNIVVSWNYDLVDPLTLHNVYSNRANEMRGNPTPSDIDPNYATNATLRDFDQFISKMRNKGTLRAEFQLFVYLISCTWTFNISPDRQRGAYKFLNRKIPVQSNGEPDPNDPIVQEIINYNRQLTDMYREIITSLRHPGN